MHHYVHTVTKHLTRPTHVSYNPYDISLDVNKTKVYGTALCSSMGQTLSLVIINLFSFNWAYK